MVRQKKETPARTHRMHAKHQLLVCTVVVSVYMAVAALLSCSSNVVYSSYEHSPLSGWERNDTLVFNVPAVANSSAYRQRIGLRMTGSFPFTSLSLIVEQRIYPSGKVVADTLKCPVTDERGNFLGDGISAFQYSFELREMALNAGDSLHVTVRHNMKREILPGVSDVGLIMERQ